MKFLCVINGAIDYLLRSGCDCTRMMLTVSYGIQGLCLLASVSIAVSLDPHYSQTIAFAYTELDHVAYLR